MPLHLITGRAGSGKSEKILSLAAENNGLLIVPETHSLSSEKGLLPYCKALGMGGAEVLSFQRLAHTFSDFGPLGKKSLDPAGKNMAVSIICRKYSKNFSAFKSASLKPGFTSQMLSLIKELKRYEVTAESLISASEKTDRKILSEKLKDIAFIYEKYLEFTQSGYTDSDDDLLRLCEFLENNRPFLYRNIYIDKFSSFTPIEYSVIYHLIAGSASVTVALCTDSSDLGFQFQSAEGTVSKLYGIAEALGDICTEEQLTSHLSGELSHLEKNFFSFIPKKYDKKTECISLFAADSIYSEVEYAAREIIKLSREENVSFSDISVIVRDSAVYAPFIKSIFPLFGIAYTNTERESASLHPLSLYVLSAAETVISSFSYSPLMRYLKSGFCDISLEETDLLENYILSCGIYGSQFASDEKWTYKADIYKGSLSDKELLDKIDTARKKILPPLLSLKEKLKGKLKASDFCRALYEFMEETNLPDKVTALINSYNENGRTDDGAKLLSVYNCIISAMDSLIACSGDFVMSSKDFLGVFSEGISSVTTSIIPSGADCVNFAGASRAKGGKSPVVFILGLNDKIFPKIPDNSGILTDSDRTLMSELDIELAPDTEHLNYEEQSLLYATLTMAKEKLFLSYSLKDADGNSMSESSAVKKIEEIFPGISKSADALLNKAKDYISSAGGTLCHMLSALNKSASGEIVDEEWLMVYDWFLKSGLPLPRIPNSFSVMTHTVPLDSDITKELFPDGFKTSISKLESYSSCHFKYYMQYILGARKRKIADFGNADAGSILHLYAENVSRHIYSSNKSWTDISEEEIREVLKGTTASVIENGSYYLKNTERALYLLNRLEHLSLKMLMLIKRHFESGLFEPLGSEIIFDDNSEYGPIILPSQGGAVRLTGKVDRADVLHTDQGDFIRIIDYKSGNKTFSLSEVYNGLNLQLSVYMMALCSEGQNPGGMLYFRLEDPIITGFDSKGKKKDREKIEKDRSDAERMKGLLLDSDIFLSSLDPSITKSVDKSNILHAKGEFYDASLATKDNFKSIFLHIKKIVSSLAAEMRSGNVNVSPVKCGEASSCDYCEFKPACSGRLTPKALEEIKDSVWEYFSNSEKS